MNLVDEVYKHLMEGQLVKCSIDSEKYIDMMIEGLPEDVPINSGALLSACSSIMLRALLQLAPNYPQEFLVGKIDTFTSVLKQVIAEAYESNKE